MSRPRRKRTRPVRAARLRLPTRQHTHHHPRLGLLFAVLDLQLRANSKISGLEPVAVRSIEHADKHPKEIEKWINSIKKLHRNKPPPQVHYSHTMPDIEQLMQVWPEEFEEILKQVSLPSAELDVELQEYARIVCAMLDIPVHTSLVQPLHVLFTLYSEFKSNQHFMNAGQEAVPPGTASSAVMRSGSTPELG